MMLWVVGLLIATIGTGVLFTQRDWLKGANKDTTSRLLLCTTRHARFHPVKNDFKYTLLYVGVFLDGNSDRKLLDGFILSIEPQDYLGKQSGKSIREKLFDRLQAHDEILKKAVCQELYHSS